MHSSYSCRFFPRPPPLQICGGALLSYVTRSQRFRHYVSRWGCFFGSFLVLQYTFLLIFNASFVYFSQFSFGFSFWFLLCIRYAAPCFYVCIIKNGSSLAGRGDCGGDEICVVETKAARLSLKGSSIHPDKKSKGCKWRFQVYTLLKIFFALKVHFWVCDRLEMSFW